VTSPIRRGGPAPSASTACGAISGTHVGALLAGLTADIFGLRPAIWIIAAITPPPASSSRSRMYETHRPGLAPPGGNPR
jgi:hypothetical protein